MITESRNWKKATAGTQSKLTLVSSGPSLCGDAVVAHAHIIHMHTFHHTIHTHQALFRTAVNYQFSPVNPSVSEGDHTARVCLVQSGTLSQPMAFTVETQSETAIGGKRTEYHRAGNFEFKNSVKGGELKIKSFHSFDYKFNEEIL